MGDFDEVANTDFFRVLILHEDRSFADRTRTMVPPLSSSDEASSRTNCIIAAALHEDFMMPIAIYRTSSNSYPVRIQSVQRTGENWCFATKEKDVQMSEQNRLLLIKVAFLWYCASIKCKQADVGYVVRHICSLNHQTRLQIQT